MIIARYLTREIAQALLTVTLILVLAFTSQQLVRYLNYAAIGKIPINVLLELVSFEVPYLTALLLPLGLYLGILLSFGRLYADSEMSILELYGIDNQRLLQLTGWVTLMVSGVVLVLMLWVNPWISSKRQEIMESDKATLHLIQTIMPGRFQVSPDGNHVIYVEELSRNRERAENVFLAQAKENKDNFTSPLWTLVSATEGYEENAPTSKEQLFITTDGYRYEGIPGQNDYKIIQFKKYTVRLPQVNTRGTHEENETLSTLQLWQDYQNPKRAAEFQWRFSIGFSAFLLALLAVPLSKIKPRQGRYVVLLPAMLIYIVYINLLFIARRWMEQGILPPSIGLWWVHGILLVLILAMLYRSKRFVGF